MGATEIAIVHIVGIVATAAAVLHAIKRLESLGLRWIDRHFQERLRKLGIDPEAK